MPPPPPPPPAPAPTRKRKRQQIQDSSTDSSGVSSTAPSVADIPLPPAVAPMPTPAATSSPTRRHHLPSERIRPAHDLSSSSSSEEETDDGVDHSDAGDREGKPLPRIFTELIMKMDELLPDSVGEALVKLRQALAPGQGRLGAKGSKTSFEFKERKPSPPVTGSYADTDRLREERLTSGKNPSLPFSAMKRRKLYRVAGDLREGKAAKVNPCFFDLLGKKVTDAGKVPILGSLIVQLEEHLIAQEGRFNFLFWMLGFVIELIDKPQIHRSEPLRNQGVESALRTCLDLLHENAIALSNVRYWRRDSLISKLPPDFTDEDKRRLHRASIKDKFLFSPEVLKEMEEKYDKRITRNLMVASIKQKSWDKSKTSPLATHPYESASKPSQKQPQKQKSRRQQKQKSRGGRGGRKSAAASSKSRGGKQSF